eukprot:2485190-Rhodomonas_salina.1
MPSTPAVRSSKATMPSLANNPLCDASLLDLQDSKEVQPLISLSCITNVSRRRGLHLVQACPSLIMLDVVQACPSLIMSDNLTVEEHMMVDHLCHGHCLRTTRMRILKRHGSEGLPRGFVTLLNKFSCKVCQLALCSRQYRKSQCMKQQCAAKQASNQNQRQLRLTWQMQMLTKIWSQNQYCHKILSKSQIWDRMEITIS